MLLFLLVLVLLKGCVKVIWFVVWCIVVVLVEFFMFVDMFFKSSDIMCVSVDLLDLCLLLM